MKRSLRILAALGLLLGIAWVIYAVAQRPAPPASGSIVLPDGSWVHIEAATYGTNHLVGPPLSHVAFRMPQFIRILMTRTFGRRAAMRFTATTSSPKLVLWLNRGMVAGPFPSSLGYLECVLSDTNGVDSGNAVPFAARWPLTALEVGVFPRRLREINLSIYRHDATGAVFQLGNVVFANPAYRRWPEWKPEPLPATKRGGDVEVTLEKIRTGIDESFGQEKVPNGHMLEFSTNTRDGKSATVCVMRLHPTTNTNETWRVVGVVTSDATGNQVASDQLHHDQKAGYVVFSPALWVSEPAWKLNFEIIRDSGFRREELFTFYNVPLGMLNATNQIGRATNCNGALVTLEQTAWREQPQKNDASTQSSEFELHLSLANFTNDLHLDLLSAPTDVGPELTGCLVGDYGTNRVYHFKPPPAGAKSANFTFAVQRSRRVEFLVKPETGVLKLESKDTQ